MLVSAFFTFDHIRHYLDDYVLKSSQEKFGTRNLAPEREEKIRQIALEMKIDTPFIIRKMNQAALLALGYHNAFCYFPALFNSIPISNIPFLFVSEGFFEDLSEGEQRFIIGHELVHIREHHVQYLNLVMLIAGLLLLIGCWYITKLIMPFKVYIPSRYHTFFSRGTSCILFYSCLVIPNLCGLAYRRHIERVADYESLTMLKSYDGACKLIDRWQKEFNLPLHNPYYGLFSDHPSCQERITYCLNLKNELKDNV